MYLFVINLATENNYRLQNVQNGSNVTFYNFYKRMIEKVGSKLIWNKLNRSHTSYVLKKFVQKTIYSLKNKMSTRASVKSKTIKQIILNKRIHFSFLNCLYI